MKKELIFSSLLAVMIAVIGLSKFAFKKDIKETIEQIYSIELSEETISNMTKSVSEEVVNTIRQLVKKETDKATLAKDVDMMPAWMKRIVKPMLTD